MISLQRIVSLLVIALSCLSSIVHAGEYRYPANNKVLFYAPGYGLGGADATTEEKEQYKVTQAGLALFKEFTLFGTKEEGRVALINESASVNAVRSFGDYGTVVIHTHGYFWAEPWEYDNEMPPSPNPTTPGFRSGTVVTFSDWNLPNDKHYLDDLAAHRLAISKNPNDEGAYHYVVFPSYIDEYIPKGDLEGNFFFLNYCHSLQNDLMWDVLEKKGAKVAFGYDNEFYRLFGEAMFFTGEGWDANSSNEYGIMRSMLPSGDSQLPLTAKEAFAAIPDDNKICYKEDANRDITSEVFANFVMRSATVDPEWQNYIYLPFPIILHPVGVSNDYLLYQADEDNIIQYTAILDNNFMYQTNFGFINYNILDVPLYKSVPEQIWPAWLDTVFSERHLPTYRHSWSYRTGDTNYAFVVFRDYVTLPVEIRNRLETLNRLMPIGMRYWLDTSLTGFAKDVQLTVKPGYLADVSTTASVVGQNENIRLSLQDQYGEFALESFSTPVLVDPDQDNLPQKGDIFFKITRSADLLGYEYGETSLEMPIIWFTGVYRE